MTPTDRFRVRECPDTLMFLNLSVELLQMLHARPLVSADVGGDRYSVGYSVASERGACDSRLRRP